MAHSSDAQPPALSAGPLRLEFHRSADRYAHSLKCVNDGVPCELMASIEGQGTERFPPSPPLQQLHFEEHGGKQVAMLVGMAEGNHWSAAISAENESLEFDIACHTSARLVAHEYSSLGSTYHAIPTAKLKKTDNGILLQLAAARVLVQTSQFTEVDLTRGTLCLRPLAGSPHPTSTLRWRYLINS
ncbi:MAG: hypothetical protein MPJ50_04955 [Pirellulales bacterium]|nr:hypothetical protein [Pirellulales bacterium]